jgi:hypothetical protein
LLWIANSSTYEYSAGLQILRSGEDPVVRGHRRVSLIIKGEQLVKRIRVQDLESLIRYI